MGFVWIFHFLWMMDGEVNDSIIIIIIQVVPSLSNVSHAQWLTNEHVRINMHLVEQSMFQLAVDSKSLKIVDLQTTSTLQSEKKQIGRDIARNRRIRICSSFFMISSQRKTTSLPSKRVGSLIDMLAVK